MKRNQSLDVLRAVAAVSVLGFHLEYYRLWSRAGWIGVDLFFVLSGFLISGLLFREYRDTGGIRVRRFLIRRGPKIWPSYYLLLIGVTLIYLLTSPSTLATLKKQLILNFLVLQNYLPGIREQTYLILGHTWTLAVEEHFYLMLLLLLVLFIRSGNNPFRVIPLLSLAIVIICLGFRIFTLHSTEIAWATHMRIDGLFGGVLLGYLYHFKSKCFDRLTRNYSLILAGIFVAPAFFVSEESRWMQTFGHTSLTIGFILLVAWAAVRNPKGRVMNCVARIGLYSYSTYLWHTMFVVLFLHYQPITFTKFWLYVVSCIAGGIGMAQLVEIPYLRMPRSVVFLRACR